MIILEIVPRESYVGLICFECDIIANKRVGLGSKLIPLTLKKH